MAQLMDFKNRSIRRPLTSKYNGKIYRPSTGRYHYHDSPNTSIDYDFRPIRIRVFKNGDRFDSGTDISVTRREFKHWLMLLDMITKKINSTQVVQVLFDLDGDEVTEFRELEDGGNYVAAGYEHFKSNVRYGQHHYHIWQPTSKHITAHDPTSVDSHESIEIYLKKMGFESQSGKVFPMDDPDRNPQTKAVIQAAALEKALHRQQLKEDRAATRLSHYRSEGSLPKIEETNHVVQRTDKDKQDQMDYYSNMHEEKYRGYYRDDYSDPSKSNNHLPSLSDWNQKNRISRWHSLEDQTSDQGYNSGPSIERSYLPPPQSGKSRRYNGSIKSLSYLRPKTNKGKNAEEIFERLYRERGSTAHHKRRDY